MWKGTLTHGSRECAEELGAGRKYILSGYGPVTCFLWKVQSSKVLTTSQTKSDHSWSSSLLPGTLPLSAAALRTKFSTHEPLEDVSYLSIFTAGVECLCRSSLMSSRKQLCGYVFWSCRPHLPFSQYLGVRVLKGSPLHPLMEAT